MSLKLGVRSIVGEIEGENQSIFTHIKAARKHVDEIDPRKD